MRKKHKKLTACAVAAMLGLSCMVYPIHAEGARSDRQADTDRLLEVDKTAVPMEETAEPQAAPAPEADEPEPVTQEQTENEADKEEPTSEPVKTAQEVSLEAMEQISREAEPQEQPETVNMLSSARASTISIGSPDALIDFATKINNGTYSEDTNAVLTGNIDMSGKTLTPIGTGKTYRGTFDGKRHTIRNLTIKSTEMYVGLFGEIQNATIGNVGVTGNISGQDSVGGIVGIEWGGSTIENCWNGASISASNQNAGGIVGWLDNGSSSVKNCYNYGNVSSGTGCAGGIVGTLWSGRLENCFSTGAVTNGSAVVSTNYGTVSNCYYLQNGTLTDSSATAATAEEFKSGKITWLLNGDSSDGVWKQTIGTDDFPSFTGQTVYKKSDGTFSNDPSEKAPTPTFTTTQTASSITVNLTNYQSDYGQVQYKWDNGDWGTSNTLSNSSANASHTVSVRYMGQGKYTQSGEQKQDIKTKSADYTISIPAVTLEAGKEDSTASISVDDKKAFDLGHNGHVDVTIKNDGNISNDGKLTLTRTGASNTITSALFVNGTALGNINTSIATFKAKNDSPVTVSFAKPTETDIPAGTYKGTITFVVSYSEQ